MTAAETIRPGLIVSLHTAVVGGVRYARTDLDAPQEGKGERARWETTRTIEDPEEWRAARAAQSAASCAIWKVCVRSPFGLLCPMDREPLLDEAISRARAIVAAHNATARVARVELRVLKGRLGAEDVVEIASEVTGRLETADQQIAAGDAKGARKAATAARSLAEMLGEAAAAKVREAVKAARAAAREVAKAGEEKKKNETSNEAGGVK
jgi:hypothetical protein